MNSVPVVPVYKGEFVEYPAGYRILEWCWATVSMGIMYLSQPTTCSFKFERGIRVLMLLKWAAIDT